MTIKFNSKFVTVDGKRVGVTYSVGPWVAGVNPDLIKIHPRRDVSLASLHGHFVIENNSDMREDYFEADSIRVLPGHPLYDALKAVA
jgi:hypothetical protein